MTKLVYRCAVVAGTLAAAAAGIACAAILGLEELPPRPVLEASTASETGSVEDAGCVPEPTRVCQCGTHAFCTEFDRGDADLEWVNPISGGVGPFPRVSAGASVALSLVDDHVSAPFGVESYASTPGGSSYLILLRSVDGGPPGDAGFQGVRYTFQIKIKDFDFSADGGATDGGSAYSAYVAALLTGGGRFPPGGVSLLVGAQGIFMAATTNVFEGAASSAIETVFNGNFAAYLGGFAPVEIVVAPKARALAEGFDSCSKVAEGAVGAVRIAGTKQACATLPPELQNIESWAASPVIALGAGMFGAGRIRLVHDNVTVDFYE